MVSTVDGLTREQLVSRVSELVPVLREKSAWMEENRRLHPEAIDLLAEAGLFKLRRPRRYGGYEVDTRTLVDIGAQLARADGSLSWTIGVYWTPTYITGMFPDEAQDEVFATEDVRVSGSSTPSVMAAPVDGGVILNGPSKFATGALHAHWQEVAAILLRPDAEPEPIMALVPMTDLELVDDWHTSGLKATGSITTLAKDVFVPQHRVIPMHAAMIPQTLSKANAESIMYRTPTSLVAAASGAGTPVGLAEAAFEVFLERLPDRKITYTNYEKQSEAPITHTQVGTARLKIDAAWFHAERCAKVVDEKCASGEPWKLEERTQVRVDWGQAAKLSKEAVDILFSASGGSAIFQNTPLPRIVNDINAVNLHALINPDTNIETYGRVLCGLEPNTVYI
ncbi:alkylation response protein AidB-like acyl-CoA dehydrogenase [Saccharothrix australiensis]|uniref:Alkylation response protein AidB-like acyl-CoA dehydrogenase n=1 Tax=Saccharothrix australiensis TaxID=2072 RepID=A0A495W230_9PSEU|nr:acyl-CoA dehydrogenase family protein [Saccharothrix australiensis]RKT55190.1 alkylation response protein AidB-like acyl-CoA dehydrogenase [Saccharothrix australiensis]